MPLTISGRFKNRYEAGRELAKKIKESKLALGKKALIVAIPGGGIPVGAALAAGLSLPMDLILVKKITPPGSHELAIGAVAEDGGLLVDEKRSLEFGATPEYIEQQQSFILTELKRRGRVFSDMSNVQPIKDRTVVLVDDGMATGYTVRAAAESLKRQGAAKVIVAVPVASDSAMTLVEPAVDTVIAVQQDPAMLAVGSYYVDFKHVSDGEVITLLREHGETP